MPLLKGKAEIGHNVREMESAGHPRNQAVAAALREAGVPKARDMTATAPNAGIPQGGLLRAADFAPRAWSGSAAWNGRRI